MSPGHRPLLEAALEVGLIPGGDWQEQSIGDRKSTRLNSSHLGISYAVFCLKKKINPPITLTGHVAAPCMPNRHDDKLGYDPHRSCIPTRQTHNLRTKIRRLKRLPNIRTMST